MNHSSATDVFSPTVSTLFEDFYYTHDYGGTDQNNGTISITAATEKVPREWNYFSGQILRFFVSPLTMIGNGLVIATVLNSKQLRNNANDLFVANLAAVDLCFGAFVVFMMGQWSVDINWKYGDIPCRLTLWAEITINAISNNALACLSFSKFLYVAYPFHFDRWMNRTVVTVLLGIAWLYPMPITVPSWIINHPQVVIFYDALFCEFSFSNTYLISGTCLLFLLPLLTIIFFGVRVIMIAHQHRRKIACIEMFSENLSLKRSSWKALRSYILVVLVYLCLQGPLHVASFVQSACRCVPYLWFYHYLAFPFWMSGMVNPFIYFFSEKYYRRNVYRLVTWGKYRPPEE